MLPGSSFVVGYSSHPLLVYLASQALHSFKKSFRLFSSHYIGHLTQVHPLLPLNSLFSLTIWTLCQTLNMEGIFDSRQPKSRLLQPLQNNLIWVRSNLARYVFVFSLFCCRLLIQEVLGILAHYSAVPSVLAHYPAASSAWPVIWQSQTLGSLSISPRH